MKNAAFLLLFLVPVVLSPLPGVGAVALSWDFDQGSLGGWSQSENGEVELTLAETAKGFWYFFRIDGVDNQTVTFVLPRANSGHFTKHSLPAISYDQTNWFYGKDKTVLPNPDGPETLRYTFTHTFAQDHAWIAFSPPYPNPSLDLMLAQCAADVDCSSSVIGISPGTKQVISVVSITDASKEMEKKEIVLLAREEPHASAGSWVLQGAMRFLLSDDPVADAVKRRCVFHFIPILDRDGVAAGLVEHPVNASRSVALAQTWDEKQFSIYEQRAVKEFLQRMKDEGRKVDLSIRLGSRHWTGDRIQPENATKPLAAEETKWISDILVKKYLPWYAVLEKQERVDTFSNAVFTLFPDSLTASMQSDFVYEPPFEGGYPLLKTTDDLMDEGMFLILSICEYLGVPASDPPPVLMGEEIYETVGSGKNAFHARCVYRDALNRPPAYVRVVVNGQYVDLSKANPENQDYARGALYTGFFNVERRTNTHFFTASNGSKTVQSPQSDARPGPYLSVTQR